MVFLLKNCPLCNTRSSVSRNDATLFPLEDILARNTDNCEISKNVVRTNSLQFYSEYKKRYRNCSRSFGRDNTIEIRINNEQLSKTSNIMKLEDSNVRKISRMNISETISRKGERIDLVFRWETRMSFYGADIVRFVIYTRTSRLLRTYQQRNLTNEVSGFRGNIGRMLSCGCYRFRIVDAFVAHARDDNAQLLPPSRNTNLPLNPFTDYVHPFVGEPHHSHTVEETLERTLHGQRTKPLSMISWNIFIFVLLSFFFRSRQMKRRNLPWTLIRFSPREVGRRDSFERTRNDGPERNVRYTVIKYFTFRVASKDTGWKEVQGF